MQTRMIGEKLSWKIMLFKTAHEHQGTLGPPEWAKIIDLMMFSPAKKSDSKKHF